MLGACASSRSPASRTTTPTCWSTRPATRWWSIPPKPPRSRPRSRARAPTLAGDLAHAPPLGPRRRRRGAVRVAPGAAGARQRVRPASTARIPRQTRGLREGDALAFDGHAGRAARDPRSHAGRDRATSWMAACSAATRCSSPAAGACSRARWRMMQRSLAKLRALPERDTRVYCGHEYTRRQPALRAARSSPTRPRSPNAHARGPAPSASAASRTVPGRAARRARDQPVPALGRAGGDRARAGVGLRARRPARASSARYAPPRTSSEPSASPTHRRPAAVQSAASDYRRR